MDESERAEFLKTAYKNETLQTDINGVHIGFEYRQGGLLYWSEKEQNKITQTFMTWDFVQRAVALLLKMQKKVHNIPTIKQQTENIEKAEQQQNSAFFVAEKNVEQLSLDLQQSQEHNISTEETEQPQILYVQHQQKNNEPLQQHNIEQSSENNDILEPQQSQEHKISTEETEQLQTLYVQPSPQKMERLQYDDLKQMYPDYLIGINIQNFYQFYGKDADIISKQFHREVIKNMGESISLKIPLDLEEIKVLLKKQNIILTDKKEYIPFTNTIELENRPFQFDGINFDTGNVVLRDLEMSGTFPLFREEKISFVY